MAIELPGYADGKLDAATTETVRKHLESCAACRGEVRELRRLSGLLATGLPSVEPSRTFAFTFAGRLAAEIDEETVGFSEGLGVILAAIEEAVPAEVLSAALYTRFRSRQEHTFAEKILSAMRKKFGGHVEPRSGKK